jgi:diacylglycerol kinase (ATP)
VARGIGAIRGAFEAAAAHLHTARKAPPRDALAPSRLCELDTPASSAHARRHSCVPSTLIGPPTIRSTDFHQASTPQAADGAPLRRGAGHFAAAKCHIHANNAQTHGHERQSSRRVSRCARRERRSHEPLGPTIRSHRCRFNPYKGNRGLTRAWHAMKNSLAGFRVAIREESAFRQELTLAAILVPCGVLRTGRPGGAGVLLLGSVLLVLIVELLNSSVEAAIDRISLERHELSRRAKDLGSAAVMVAPACV